MTPDAPEVSVRALRGTDRAAWDTLWHGYLDFYDETVDAATTDVVFHRLVDPGWPQQFGLVAEIDGALHGFAHLGLHPSTWDTASDCYLEDLFVTPSSRGNGVAHALFGQLVTEGRDLGWRRIHWLTGIDNDTARRLYDDVGELQEQVRYAIDL